MTMVSGGVYLRRKGSFGACDGNLRVQVWHLAVETSGVIADLAMGLAAAHVPSQAPLAHPNARIADRLAPKGATRTGDFGEFLAAALYADRFGEIVPFQKLSTKPVAGATQQGADVLALSPLPADMPRAGAIEIKVRTAISPKALLEDISKSVRRVDPDYLVGAWNAAVNAMEAHPDHAQSFALAAAISLAQLDRPSQPGPDHEHHAVIVTESATLHAATINKYWGSHPPVSELQLIEVPGLVEFIDQVYEAAAELSYSDTAGSAPAYLAGLGVTPGVAAAVSVTSARDATATTGRVAGVEEVALWYLAGWDGMAAARADQIIHDASSTEALGLAWLLFGSSRRALDTFNHTGPLADLSEAAAELWQQRSDLENFCNAADAAVAAIADPGLGRGTRLAAAAISYRFDRHPARLLAAAGATGANVTEVVRNLTRKGRRALWPSQAKAVQAGLFDAHEKGLAIKMPTSAGKTLLIQLAVAHTLDLDASGVAAVIAPTKALVRQLTHDLREALPKSTAVRSSQGGLDYDEPASAGALLAEAGVVVVTPERLDLEWRRAVTSTEGTNIENLRLLVVDEAHLVAETSRGGRLELLIARALRAGVRVILLSSQFPDTARLESWLGAPVISSDWGPTWLQRHVYHRSDDKQIGLLADESGTETKLFDLVPSVKSRQPGVPRDRCHEAASVAERLAGAGLVVVFSDKRSYMDKLSAAVRARFAATTVEPALEEAIAVLKDSHPDYWEALRHGVGIHHAHVPLQVRRTVEHCARRNLLACIVCTSTLLEGVDFPTKTVICAYPPQSDQGTPNVARLRNLAGRAGRGGRYTSGMMVVMVKRSSDANKWLKAFRAELPVTGSALERALNYLKAAPDFATGTGPGPSVAAVDALVLEALAEGAVTSGELRTALEIILSHTLWFTGQGMHPATRDRVLDRATQWARRVHAAFAADSWSTVVYRTGLPLRSALALRDVLAPYTTQLAQAFADPGTDYLDLLGWLVTTIAPQVPELQGSGWADLDASELAAATSAWLGGVSTEDDLQAAWPATWPPLAAALESLLPWVLTAAVEIAVLAVRDADPLTTAASIVDLSADTVHARLGVSRLRYGVPQVELCDVVRDGVERADACRLAAQFDQLDPLAQLLSGGLAEYVRTSLEAEVEAETEPDSYEDPFGDAEPF